MINILSKEALFAVSNSGKVIIVSKITYEPKKTEDEDDFFSKVGVVNKKVDIYSSEPCDKWISSSTKKQTVDFSNIPESIVDTITQAIEATKNFDKNSNYEKGSFTDEQEADIMEDLQKNIAQFNDKLKKLSITGDGLDILTFSKRYMFKKHVLIKGERGTSKTFSIDKFLNDNELHTIFMTAHEGIESQDMVGYYTKDATGGLVWLDGTLTQAFRLAQKQKVVLFIDEMLRIPARELNVLIGSISPSSKGTFKLRTNRIVNISDGIGETEMLEVPQENLWVAATTNVGAKYNVEEIDHALSDRFRVYEKTLTPYETRQIITFWLDMRGFDSKWVDRFVNLEEKIRALFNSGEIENIINIRHISELIQYAETESDFISYAVDLLPNLCGVDMNGQIEKTEKELILKLIKNTLK
ncbi:MAG: AAA family ATPase [Prolixibacteraceae bacterium]|nr:AAA family ATPase [Prolixibacteraceae bacterium]